MTLYNTMQQIWRRMRLGKPVYVVSGLPRSGTSMMMNMLAAGGIELVQDDVRQADEDNPLGYYELERVKDLHTARNKEWLRAARGQGVKVISQLLESLPSDNLYKVIFMERDIDEVLASQSKMLARRGEEEGSADDREMKEIFAEHLSKIRFILRRRPYFEALYCAYSDVVSDPRESALRVQEFAGRPLNIEAMCQVVQPQLYRNRADGKDEGGSVQR